MNVRNCRNCGSIFNYVSGAVICPVCREKLEKKFQEVKDYVRENKGAGIQEVAEACEVETGQIRQWLREGRLELSADSAVFLNCESCGKPIRSGRFCEKCTVEMTKGFRDVLRDKKPAVQKPVKKEEDGAKMRFLK